MRGAALLLPLICLYGMDKDNSSFIGVFLCVYIKYLKVAE